MAANDFKSALIIVDLQEDFCPPVSTVHIYFSLAIWTLNDESQNGSLAVPGGRDIIPVVNKLLHLPFDLKIATKDWHPADHISFASNHEGKKPYTDFTTIINPENPVERYETRLWPDHCIQNTKGAELVPGLDMNKIEKVIEKGQVTEVEMYSAFYTPLNKPRVGDSGLAGLLKNSGITDVFVVGLAADYCVFATAFDAAQEGFKTYIVEEGTKPVDESFWKEKKEELKSRGVDVVSILGKEVKKVEDS